MKTKMKTKKVEITLDVPDDFDLDENEIEFIGVLAVAAARRGSSIEDTVACEKNQRGLQGAAAGARRIQVAVRELAGLAFAEKRDAEATTIRKLADQLDPYITKLDNERRQHEELFIDSFHRKQDARRRGEKVES